MLLVSRSVLIRLAGVAAGGVGPGAVGWGVSHLDVEHRFDGPVGLGRSGRRQPRSERVWVCSGADGAVRHVPRFVRVASVGCPPIDGSGHSYHP